MTFPGERPSVPRRGGRGARSRPAAPDPHRRRTRGHPVSARSAPWRRWPADCAGRACDKPPPAAAPRRPTVPPARRTSRRSSTAAADATARPIIPGALDHRRRRPPQWPAGLVLDGRRRGVWCQTAVPAARARESIRLDDHVAELAGAAARPRSSRPLQTIPPRRHRTREDHHVVEPSAPIQRSASTQRGRRCRSSVGSPVRSRTRSRRAKCVQAGAAARRSRPGRRSAPIADPAHLERVGVGWPGGDDPPDEPGSAGQTSRGGVVTRSSYDRLRRGRRRPRAQPFESRHRSRGYLAIPATVPSAPSECFTVELIVSRPGRGVPPVSEHSGRP